MDEKETELDEMDNLNTLEDVQYDDEGNVIIPDEDDETSDEDGAGADDADTIDDGEKAEGNTTSESDRIAELEKQLAEERNKNTKQSKQGIEILKKLGFEGDTFEEALAKAGAEADDTSVEEFLKKQKEEADQEEANELLKRTKFEQLKKADLDELKPVFPNVEDIKALDDLEKMENFKRFGELRDLGLSVEEAYRAANPRAIEKKVVESTKQHNLNATKDHLKSNVPKGTRDTYVRMSHEEMEIFRDAFPNKTDAEILALYKQTKD